jgi:pyridoxine/pyridoxamine 5'-phosphate oxidase
VLLAALGLTGAVYYLRRRVQKSIVSNDDVSSAKAERGSVSTTVSGSGTLENVDEEEMTTTWQDRPGASSIYATGSCRR